MTKTVGYEKYIKSRVAQVANSNEANKAYWAAKKSAVAIAQQIERKLLETPVQTSGNWGLVGDMEDYRDSLQQILDKLAKTGEFAE